MAATAGGAPPKSLGLMTPRRTALHRIVPNAAVAGVVNAARRRLKTQRLLFQPARTTIASCDKKTRKSTLVSKRRRTSRRSFLTRTTVDTAWLDKL